MPPKSSKNILKFENLIKEINSFEKRINDCDDNKSRIGVLKSKVKDFDNRLTDLFSELSSHESDAAFDEYIQYKEKLVEWGIGLEEKAQSTNNANGNNNAVPNAGVRSQGVINLPKLEVPHFYGTNESWISFKELFRSSILDNKSLNEIEKLQYLQASVKGDAAKLIRGFSITGENLKNCWDTLCSRYENKRQLALGQINKLFTMKVSKANTSKLLLELIDVCNEVIRNLQTIGLDTNPLTELIIINFLMSKVDGAISQRWELTLEVNELPTLDEFRMFIEKEARGLGEVKVVKPELKKCVGKQINSYKSNVNTTLVKGPNGKLEAGKRFCCILCSQDHGLFRCTTFHSMGVTERWQFVKDHDLCANCLRGNHKLDACRSGFPCKNCSARHHTLLHQYSAPEENPTQTVITVSNSCRQFVEGHVLLSTALIKVNTGHGQQVTCRALIDNAAQNSLISKQCAEQLKLPLSQTNHRLIGVNETFAETSLYSTNIDFSSCVSAEGFQVSALVVSKVTSAIPNFPIKFYEWPHIKGLALADPSFHVESDVDILLGADVFLSLITGPPIMGPKGTPAALPTKLGHLLSRRISAHSSQKSSVVCHALVDIDSSLKQFWELESVPRSSQLNDEDELCESIFKNSHSRNSDGRYILKLPFKQDFSLGDSREGALRRFHSLERKLQVNDNLREQYVRFMEEYQSLGHMTPVKPNLKAPHYFLPHHGVVNEQSSTTKLRVVFDGSFKSHNGKSLNEVLLKGEKLQSDIFATILKFRTYPIAFSSDIAKMYRQILITQEDTAFQQIFWRKSPADLLGVFQLNTVTYGTSCAPFLAIRTLKQLCENEKANFPRAAEIAQNHFYVDDLLAGADSVDSAREIIHEIQGLMSAGGLSYASGHVVILRC